MLILGIVALVAGAVLGVYGLVQLQQTRELLERPPAPDAGPLVLELVPVFPNGATGAVARLEVTDHRDGASVKVPPGATSFLVLVAHRAGLYAGDTTMVERESEPPPAFLGGGRR